MKHPIPQATGDALAPDADVLSRLVNRLRLKHLKFLAALGETLVLNQAARLVNTSQPAATKMLADLETAFGFALFALGDCPGFGLALLSGIFSPVFFFLMFTDEFMI